MLDGAGRRLPAPRLDAPSDGERLLRLTARAIIVGETSRVGRPTAVPVPVPVPVTVALQLLPATGLGADGRPLPVLALIRTGVAASGFDAYLRPWGDGGPDASWRAAGIAFDPRPGDGLRFALRSGGGWECWHHRHASRGGVLVAGGTVRLGGPRGR